MERVLRARPADASIYGDGSDGDGDISVPTSLSRDTYYDTLAVSSTLSTAGYRLYVRNALTIASGGIIADDGNAAVTLTGGAALGARGTLGTDSGAGANGRSTIGNGATGGAGSAQIFNNTSTPNGGNGGGADGSRLGGLATAPTIRSASGGSIRAMTNAIIGRCCASTGTWQSGGGGGGGGAGGCNPGTGSASSGSGGGGGGSVVICARIFNSAGTVRANGGAGSAGSVTGDGLAGGGGGGAGGWVSILAGRLIARGTVQASGGAGGAAAGTGAVAGQSGSAGYTQVLVMSA